MNAYLITMKTIFNVKNVVLDAKSANYKKQIVLFVSKEREDL